MKRLFGLSPNTSRILLGAFLSKFPNIILEMVGKFFKYWYVGFYCICTLGEFF